MAHELTQFNEWIRAQHSGLTDDEITAAMATVVEGVQHLQKKGKVVIEIGFEIAGSGGRSVTAEVKVTAKPPEPAPTPTFYFVGDHGSLHRDDPYQQRFEDVRTVDAGTGEVRTIPTTTSEED